MMHCGCRELRPYDATMIGTATIGTAIASQPQRTDPDWISKVATSPAKERSSTAANQTRVDRSAGGFWTGSGPAVVSAL